MNALSHFQMLADDRDRVVVTEANESKRIDWSRKYDGVLRRGYTAHDFFSALICKRRAAE